MGVGEAGVQTLVGLLSLDGGRGVGAGLLRVCYLEDGAGLLCTHCPEGGDLVGFSSSGGTGLLHGCCCLVGAAGFLCVLEDRITAMVSCSIDVTRYSSQSREFELMNLQIVLSCQAC